MGENRPMNTFWNGSLFWVGEGLYKNVPQKISAHSILEVIVAQVLYKSLQTESGLLWHMRKQIFLSVKFATSILTLLNGG